MAITKLIVGLGNPGRQYEKTRHNLGAMALMRLAQKSGAVFGKCRYASALTAELRMGGEKAVLAFPTTFMNNSGQAVRDIVSFDNVALEDVLVICDDLRLGIGQMRMKLDGSDAGHNGLRSVAAHLGTEAYTRLRLGIGSPKAEDAQTDFVLGTFSAAEMKIIDGVLDDACACCELWLAGDTARAMTLYNKRKDDE